MHRFRSVFLLLLLLTASDYTTHYFDWWRAERVYCVRRDAYWDAQKTSCFFVVARSTCVWWEYVLYYMKQKFEVILRPAFSYLDCLIRSTFRLIQSQRDDVLASLVLKNYFQFRLVDIYSPCCKCSVNLQFTQQGTYARWVSGCVKELHNRSTTCIIRKSMIILFLYFLFLPYSCGTHDEYNLKHKKRDWQVYSVRVRISFTGHLFLCITHKKKKTYN